PVVTVHQHVALQLISPSPSRVEFYLIFYSIVEIFQDLILKIDNPFIVLPPVGPAEIGRIQRGDLDLDVVVKGAMQHPPDAPRGEKFGRHDKAPRAVARRPIPQGKNLVIGVAQIAAKNLDRVFGNTELEQYRAIGCGIRKGNAELLRRPWVDI